jgi:hypothetical protein
MPQNDETPKRLGPIAGFWLLFTEEQRHSVIEYCECMLETGEGCDAARLFLARRSGKES